jgi:hypothetical protein
MTPPVLKQEQQQQNGEPRKAESESVQKEEKEQKKRLDEMTIREVVFTLMAEIEQPGWLLASERFPKEYRQYFDAKYFTFKSNFPTFYSQIVQYKFSGQRNPKHAAQLLQELEQILGMFEDCQQGKQTVDEAHDQLLIEQMNKRMKPTLDDLEEKRLSKLSQTHGASKNAKMPVKRPAARH